jgi:hypothetical protein
MSAIEAIGDVTASYNRRARCCICGFSEVRTDEVFEQGVLFIAECPRCDHRWTSQQPIAVRVASPPAVVPVRFERVPARFSREVQPAA